ncbi:MAG TPA: HAMP domain-containing sensor histidine kinase, partial [Terrimicrobiaceae bacterium]
VEARLIEDLLDVTRITQNKIELHLEPLDLHVALQQALETCGSDIESQHLHLQLTLSAQKSRVEGDFARLQQVFWNLIKNAVKFTGKGGQISIRSYNIGPRIFVEISDTGIGILPDALSRIFKPFEQGGPDLVQRFGGLGLGLAISKATVEAHHGCLTAKSKGQDKGATFILELATIS